MAPEFKHVTTIILSKLVHLIAIKNSSGTLSYKQSCVGGCILREELGMNALRASVLSTIIIALTSLNATVAKSQATDPQDKSQLLSASDRNKAIRLKRSERAGQLSSPTSDFQTTPSLRSQLKDSPEAGLVLAPK